MKNLRVLSGSPSLEKDEATGNVSLANRILDEAEEAFEARSMALRRALSGRWNLPEAIGDFLFWLEDEARMQEAGMHGYPKNAAGRDSYIRALRGVASELRELGFLPAPVPWMFAG